MPPRRESAIFELDLARFGGPTTPYEETKVIATTGSELIEPNPDRLQYWITNNGPSTIYWSTVPNPSATRGHSLASGAVLIVRAFDDGAFCGERLYASANAADSTVTVSWIERAHRGA
jgi:hypothetical protein